MNAIKIKTISAFTSFKWKKDQRYHRTYELPPKTTLLGFIGAALGLREEEIYYHWQWGNTDDALLDRIGVAVLTNGIEGRIKETWTTVKNVPAKKRIESAPIVREQLFRARYVIYVQAESNNLLNYIKNKIENPTFPLSLGRDDELVRVKSVNIVPLTDPKYPIELYGILLPFNIAKMKKEIILKGILKPHLIQKLPHRFEIIDKTREPKDEGKFTFLTGYKVTIEEPIKDTYYDLEEDRNVVFL